MIRDRQTTTYHNALLHRQKGGMGAIIGMIVLLIAAAIIVVVSFRKKPVEAVPPVQDAIEQEVTTNEVDTSALETAEPVVEDTAPKAVEPPPPPPKAEPVKAAPKPKVEAKKEVKAEPAKPVAAKPIEVAKPVEPAPVAKPVEPPKAPKAPEPAKVVPVPTPAPEVTKPVTTPPAKPVEVAKPVTPPAPPKPAEVKVEPPKPVAKPIEVAKVVEPVKPAPVAKPVETPKAPAPAKVVPAPVAATPAPSGVYEADNLPEPAKVTISKEAKDAAAKPTDAGPIGDVSTNASSDFQIGSKAYQNGDYTNAVKILSKIPVPPSKQRGTPEREEYVKAKTLMGLSMQKEGHLTEAISTYQKVLEYEKYYPIVNLNLGICYLELRQYGKADRTFKTVVRDQNRIPPDQYDDIMQRNSYFWALAWTRLYKETTNNDKKRYFQTQAELKWTEYLAWYGSNNKFSKANEQAINYQKMLQSESN